MTEMRNPRPDGEYITGLARGLTVLRTFSRETPDLSLSEIAAATNLNPAVVRRCLNTLVHLGYVGRHGRRFQLRPEVTIFASAFLDSTKLREIVLPALTRLRDRTGDGTALAILSCPEIVYLLHLPADRTGPTAAGIGTRLPAKSTAMGRVLIAYTGGDFRTVRRNGHAVIQDELGTGLTAIAVPVLRADGRIFASIGCTAEPSNLPESALVKERLGALREARATIEAELTRYPMLADSAA
jgi:IclR family pca regulon transcriptional regulator